MRILVARNDCYPARAYPASTRGGAPYRLADSLAKGLAELGHDVFYQVGLGDEPLPRGVQWVSGGGAKPRVDVAYRQTDVWTRRADYPGPWIRTCHVDDDHELFEDHWICVSQTLARSFGATRVVLNGVDPAELSYSETKADYFLFLACLDRAMRKGFGTAVSLARRTGLHLVVAGSAVRPGVLEGLRAQCASVHVTFAGEANGAQRAELLAGARALLFPTQVNEAFGLVMAEALMSGTPVICSDRGACPELISSDVGFVCGSDEQYLRAIESIGAIAPSACRAKAMREYHYSRMAEGYVREMAVEIARYRPAATRRPSSASIPTMPRITSSGISWPVMR